MRCVRILRWCFPFTEVLSVCADVKFDICGICHTLGVAWSKQVNLALPHTPVVDTASTKVKAEGLRARLHTLVYIVVGYF